MAELRQGIEAGRFEDVARRWEAPAAQAEDPG